MRVQDKQKICLKNNTVENNILGALGTLRSAWERNAFVCSFIIQKRRHKRFSSCPGLTWEGVSRRNAM